MPLLSLLLSALSVSAHAAEILVTVKGLRSDQGQILVTVYDQAEGFPLDGYRAMRKARFPVTGLETTFRLQDLPMGPCALALIHDEDGDGEIDTGLFGIPKEGLGASRDARARFGPPRFEDAVVTIERERMQLTITMNRVNFPGFVIFFSC